MSNEKKVEEPLANDDIVIGLGPTSVELEERAHLGGYYPCINGVNTRRTRRTTDFFDTFPRPIGFLAMPDWVTESELEMSLLGDDYDYNHHDNSPLEYVLGELRKPRQQFTCGFLRSFRNNEGRGFTEKELKKLIEDNKIIEDRMRGRPRGVAIEINFKKGLNPVGVREFFERQVFSNPPIVKFSPALLKPYLISKEFIRGLVLKIFGRLDDDDDVPIDYVYTKFPVALYSGIFHGNTCCGQVFDNMTSREEIDELYGGQVHQEHTFTFDTKKEKIAFFSKICKMLIDGMYKDGENGDKKKECENHGNYGNTLVGLFEIRGDRALYCHFLYRFMRNHVVILLFFKIIEKNDELKKTINTQKIMTTTDLTDVKSKVFGIRTMPDADGNPVFEGQIAKGNRSDKKRVERFLPTIEPSIVRKYEVEKKSLIALMERYFSIILFLMGEAQKYYNNHEENPLNIELCREGLALYPDCDGKTMAHVLAKECPRILMRIMNSNPDKKNPIAYLIADDKGETPKSIAIQNLKLQLELDFLPLHRESNMAALSFFESLPDTQPDVEIYKSESKAAAETLAAYRAKADAEAKAAAEAVAAYRAKADAEAKAAAEAVAAARPMGYDMAIKGPDLRPILSLKDRKLQGPGPGKGGRRSRKRNNRNKKRVKTLKNKKKYRSSRARRFHSKNKK
jgi:hypothetical protein